MQTPNRKLLTQNTINDFYALENGKLMIPIVSIRVARLKEPQLFIGQCFRAVRLNRVFIKLSL